MAFFSRRSGSTETPDLQSVVSAFGRCLENRRAVLSDVRDLPYQKETIKLALTKAIQITPDATMREQLCVGLTSLADFQDLEACKKYGLKASELMLWEGEALLKLARGSKAA